VKSRYLLKSLRLRSTLMQINEAGDGAFQVSAISFRIDSSEPPGGSPEPPGISYPNGGG
jgi:hypothetical protein